MLVRETTAHVGAANVAQHFRLTTGVANTLAGLLAAPVPAKLRPNTQEMVTATVVSLQVESGQANKVYVTIDGSAPSATNGFEVPSGPSFMVLPYPDQLKNTGAASLTNPEIQLFSPGATTVQALFEWW